MNFENPIGIETREVKETQRDGQPARVVSGSRTFDTYPEDLWDAVTNPARLPRWFLPITGELETGGRYQLEGHAAGKILRCDAPNSFEVTWECGGNVSWVTVRLEADGDETLMTLEHTMLKDEANEEHWNKFGPGATGVGWDLSFVGLGVHLESGETVTEEGLAWTGSDPGKAFIRKCSAAWGVAHIASGEPAEVANDLADQTAKAYSGEQ